MYFSKRKISVETKSQLRRCPVETVKPYALMIAPVYVFLPRNAKYVAVKGPLDFFSEEELHRLKSFEMFFMPDFVDRVLPYRQIARRLKRVLNWKPNEESAGIGISPFEISDTVIRLLAPLWGPNQEIEPFFVSVFVNEFCSLLPASELTAAREKSLENFERALIVSAWMILLSLHIGVTDPGYLDALRLKTFRKILGTVAEETFPRLLPSSDSGELFQILEQTLVDENIHKSLGVGFFQSRSERVARKIEARLRRVQEDLAGNDVLEATVYGSEGFIDA